MGTRAVLVVALAVTTASCSAQTDLPVGSSTSTAASATQATAPSSSEAASSPTVAGGSGPACPLAGPPEFDGNGDSVRPSSGPVCSLFSISMTGLPLGEPLTFTYRYPGESADLPASHGTTGADGGFLTGFLAQECRFGTYSITLTAGSVTKRLSFEVVPDAAVDCSTGAPVVRGTLPTRAPAPTPSHSLGGEVVAAMEAQTSLKLEIVEGGTSVLAPVGTTAPTNCTREDAFLNCVSNRRSSLLIQKPTGVRVTAVVDVPGLTHTFEDSFHGVPSILDAGASVAPVALIRAALSSRSLATGAPAACAIGTCAVLRYRERYALHGVDQTVVATLLVDPATNLLRQADFVTTYANGRVLTTTFTYSDYGVPNTIP